MTSSFKLFIAIIMWLCNCFWKLFSASVCHYVIKWYLWFNQLFFCEIVEKDAPSIQVLDNSFSFSQVPQRVLVHSLFVCFYSCSTLRYRKPKYNLYQSYICIKLTRCYIGWLGMSYKVKWVERTYRQFAKLKF